MNRPNDNAGAHADPAGFPALPPLAEWEPTRATLHMWTQVVGKVRLAQTPLVNHWWNVPLYLTARGLTTSAMPHGARTFQIDFDFLDHRLLVETSDGETRSLELAPRTVADFHRELMSTLAELGINPRIWTTPVEIPDPIPFERDTTHASYEPAHAHSFWLALSRSAKVFEEFRAGFLGKCSPVHFFWGSFDLAVTRFSGRRAPEREGADPITREAYSHEVVSHGFWPGTAGSPVDFPAFYSYTAPEPAGLKEARPRPAEAFYSRDLNEFVLPYEAARASADPDRTLTDFLQSTYDAGADLAGWDRASLER